jgi:hypothetical protein
MPFQPGVPSRFTPESAVRVIVEAVRGRRSVGVERADPFYSTIVSKLGLGQPPANSQEYRERLARALVLLGVLQHPDADDYELGLLALPSLGGACEDPDSVLSQVPAARAALRYLVTEEQTAGAPKTCNELFQELKETTLMMSEMSARLSTRPSESNLATMERRVSLWGDLEHQVDKTVREIESVDGHDVKVAQETLDAWLETVKDYLDRGKPLTSDCGFQALEHIATNGLQGFKCLRFYDPDNFHPDSEDMEKAIVRRDQCKVMMKAIQTSKSENATPEQKHKAWSKAAKLTMGAVAAITTAAALYAASAAYRGMGDGDAMAAYAKQHKIGSSFSETAKNYWKTKAFREMASDVYAPIAKQMTADRKATTGFMNEHILNRYESPDGTGYLSRLQSRLSETTPGRWLAGTDAGQPKGFASVLEATTAAQAEEAAAAGRKFMRARPPPRSGCAGTA